MRGESTQDTVTSTCHLVNNTGTIWVSTLTWGSGQQSQQTWWMYPQTCSGRKNTCLKMKNDPMQKWNERIEKDLHIVIHILQDNHNVMIIKLLLWKIIKLW